MTGRIRAQMPKRNKLSVRSAASSALAVTAVTRTPLSTPPVALEIPSQQGRQSLVVQRCPKRRQPLVVGVRADELRQNLPPDAGAQDEVTVPAAKMRNGFAAERALQDRLHLGFAHRKKGETACRVAPRLSTTRGAS